MCFVQESALNDEGSFFCGTTSPERFVLPWGLLLVVEMLFPLPHPSAYVQSLDGVGVYM